METLAIVGLGLMGGSLGLALKAKGYGGRIAGYTRSPEHRATALARGAVDEVFDSPVAAVEQADLVVYCAPILAIPALVRESLARLKPGAILTDVGSTKVFLVEQLADEVTRAGAHFVGSHPIAGSEKQSIDAARADLYEGATVVVTPADKAAEAAVVQVEELWRKAGALVIRTTPQAHDRMLARTSHLPHMAAAIIAATVARGGREVETAHYCGSGFRDTTRVAEGAPEIWMDILATNSEAVADELRALRDVTGEVLQQVERGDWKALMKILDEARMARRTLCGAPAINRAAGDT